MHRTSLAALALTFVLVACGGDPACRFVEGSPRFQAFDCGGVAVDVDGCPPGSHAVTPTECECDAGDFVLDPADGFVCEVP